MQNYRIHTISIGEAGLPVEVDIPIRDVQPPDTEDLPIERVVLVGVLTVVDVEYLLRGTLTGTFRGSCDRCLAVAENSFIVDVCWIFEEGHPVLPVEAPEGIGLDSKDRKFFEGNEIDLGSALWEETAFAAPGKILCREDCRGLCPQCGANLNNEECRCRQQPDRGRAAGGKGLADLASLFPDFKEEHSEE